MAGEPRPGPGQPGQKRQQDTAGFRPSAWDPPIPAKPRDPVVSPKALISSPSWTSALEARSCEKGGSSNYHLNYELHGGDAPCRGYGHQRISPLINQVPGKLQRTFMGLGVRRSCSPYKASRSRYLHPEQAKPVRTEELRSIRGKLSEIKAQVDRLLESLEHMDQRRAQAAGTKDSDKNRVPGSEGCSRQTTEAQQEPRGQREG